jgi:peptide/nickel transport system substrate-binding protein
VAEVYKGYAWLDSSPERSPSPFYKNMHPLSYDIQAAQQLLAQLQLYDRDGNGFLDLPSGKPFELTILTNEDNPLRVKMGGLISESLNKAGIRTMFRPSEYDRIVTKLLDTFDWEAVIIGVEGSIEPNDASWIWESKGPLHLWAPYMEFPQTEWEKRIDELFALGRTTWDIGKAKSFYHEYQDIIARELPVITILIPPALYGFRNDFGNIIPSTVTYNALGLLPFIYRKDRPPE